MLPQRLLRGMPSDLRSLEVVKLSSCHVNQVSCLFQGTVLEPSTSHIGQGVALVTQAAAPVYPVYISTFPSQIAEMITHSRTQVSTQQFVTALLGDAALDEEDVE